MKRNSLRLMAGVVVLVLCGASFGSTRRDDRTEADQLNLASAPEYAATGRINALENGVLTGGSGTLITPTTLVTAGHVVDGDITELRFLIGGQEYLADQWFPHDAYTGVAGSEGDIGIVHLTTPVVGVEPALRYRGNDLLGREAVGVGFGRTGTGLTGELPGTAGTKRAFTNVLEQYGGLGGVTDDRVLTDFDNPLGAEPFGLGSAVPTYLEGQGASFDSGGGLYATIDSQTYLVGVVNVRYAPDNVLDSDYGDYTGSARLSVYNSWIDSHVPEPTSAGLLGALAILCMGRRRS